MLWDEIYQSVGWRHSDRWRHSYRWRYFDGVFILFISLPLLLYLQMPISAHMKKTHWKWGHCDSLVGWLRHVFQMDHGVSIFAPANRYPDAKSSIVHFSMAIYDFWHLVSRNFGWWPNVLFFLGNVRCYFNKKTKMLWLLMVINILIFAKFLHTRKGPSI